MSLKKYLYTCTCEPPFYLKNVKFYHLHVVSNTDNIFYIIIKALKTHGFL